MIRILVLLIFLLVPGATHGSFLTDNWLTREYKQFREYPRMDKAYKLIEAKRPAEAVPLLQKVLEIDPNHKQAYITLIEICLEMGNYECVMSTAGKWKHQDSSAQLASYYLTVASHHKNLSTQAIENGLAVLNEDITLDPERIQVLLDILITELAGEGRAAEVVFWVDKSRDRDIAIPTGRILDWADELEKHDFYREANQLLIQLPLEQRVVNARVILLEKWGKPAEAASLFETETNRTLRRSSKYWLHLAELYQKSGDVSNELRSLRSGIRQVEENQPLYHALLNRMIGLKRLSESAELVESMLQVQDEPGLRLQFVDLLAATKRYDAAIEQVKIILSEEKQSQNQKIKLNGELAYFLDKSKRIEELAELLANNYEEIGDYKYLLHAEDKYRLLGEDLKRLQLLEKTYPFTNVPPSQRDYLVFELIKLYLEYDRVDKARLVVLNHAEKDLFNQKMADQLLVHCQSINRCDLAIKLAEYQMGLGTATGFTYFVVAYCVKALNKPGLALNYMEEAKKREITKEEYRSLLKEMGYLAAAQYRPEEALDYWREYLREKFDIEIVLRTVLLALTSGHAELAEPFLIELGRHGLTPGQMAQYVFAVGLVAESEGRFVHAQVLFETSLLLEHNAEVRHKLFYITKKLNDNKSAVMEISALITAQPGNSIFLAERGYLHGAVGKDEEALSDFKASHKLIPDRMTLTPEIAYALLRLGKRKEALGWFYQAADEAPYFPVGEDPGIEEDRLFGLRRAIQTLEDRWQFIFSSVVRLDSYEQEEALTPPVAFASYRGFYSGEVSYRFDEFPGGKQNGRIFLYGRSLIGMEDQSFETRDETLTFGLGIKYRLLQARNLYLSTERVIGAGDEVSDDWMVRLQGSYASGNEFKPSSSDWLFFQAYGDISYLLDQGTYYSFVESDLGYHFKVPIGATPGATLYPYLTSRYTNNNGNVEKIVVDRLDIGAGLGLNSWHLETKYRASGLHSELRLEGRTKIGGNMKDDSTVHLVWELFF